MTANKEIIELSLPSKLGLEQVAVSASASLAKLMGFSDDRIQDLMTAVEEACLNAIEHGNKQDANMKVLVALTVDESKLQIDVHDSSKTAFSPDVKKPDIDAKISGADGRTRGWGLFLIKSLMDEVEFKWSPETGNITRMVIHLKQ
ncbi:ATP-binding protein [Candidatus Poribacteria bacterium]|nr:ATP-binding protein [Candidatus Poribacteria bacterium]